jgi:autotransporter translocation and assembly factor TamB
MAPRNAQATSGVRETQLRLNPLEVAFPKLELTGKNYLSWKNDLKFYLNMHGLNEI